MSYRINMLWDGEADVWVATSEDVPGLVLESGSLDALVEKVKVAVPELIELNGSRTSAYSLEIQAKRTEPVAVYG